LITQKTLRKKTKRLTIDIQKLKDKKIDMININKFLVLITFLLLIAHQANTQTYALTVSNQGKTGIDQSNPQEQLDVNGAVRIGNSDVELAGTIRWTGKCFEGYDGTSWVSLSNSADCDGSTPAPTCSDGIQNQGEDDIDCGGPCTACPAAPTCSDGIQNQGEDDVDCGGPCAACPATPTCSDGLQNQGEDDVDCGGPCAACPAAPTCSDGIQNQGEDGVDCGGPCASCPSTPTCSDGIQNQGEDGVDCGGPCSACAGSSTCDSYPEIDQARLTSLSAEWSNEFDVDGRSLSGDGSLCWELSDLVGTNNLVIGLSEDPTASDGISTIDYGINFITDNDSEVNIYESGSNVYSFFFSNRLFRFSTFCIERNNQTITYLFDGVVRYTSDIPSNSTLSYDNSVYGAANSGTFVAQNIDLCNATSSLISGDDSSASLASNHNGIGHPNDSSINSLYAQLDDLKNKVNQLNTMSNEHPSPTHFEKLKSNNDELKFALSLPDGYSQASITVRNAQDLVIKEIDLNHLKGNGVLTFNTSDLNPGDYTINLSVDDVEIHAEQFQTTND